MHEELTNHSRRTVLQILGATAVSTSFAGCLGDTREDSDATRNRDETYVESAPDYDGWFNGVDHYGGTVAKREQDEVIVHVGAENQLEWN